MEITKIFKNNIIFSLQLKETLIKNKPTKTFSGYLFNHFHELTKTQIQKTDNAFGLRLGIVNNEKEGLILIDFDNKLTDDNGINGMDLYKYFIENQIIDKNNNYIEKTGNGGIHVIVKAEREFINSLKSSRTSISVNGNIYKVDIKANKQFSIIAPSKYITLDNKIKKYEIINNKLNFITDEMKKIVIENLSKTNKKVNKKYTKHVTNEFEPKNIITDLKILNNIMKLINPKRFDDYNTWIDIGMALKNENYNSFNIYDKYSKLSKKYVSRDDVLSYWNHFSSSRNDRGFTIGTLLMYAKQDSPNEYYKLFSSSDPKLEDVIKDNVTYIVNQFISDKINNNELNEVKTLVIKSPMNTGKTVFIKKVITENKYERILFLSHRIDFSNSIYGQFKDFNFKHYIQDKKYFRMADKVIVSIDSLYKILDINDYPFDLIILDECESLLNHFSSETLGSEKEEILNDFIDLCKKSKKLLLTDADFNLRSFNFIKQIDDKPKIIFNKYIPNNKRKVYIYRDENVLTNNIYKNLKANKKIVIICQSYGKANNLYDKLKIDFPNKNIILHTSKTSDKIKEQLGKVNEFWINYEILIFTSTIESGIDFNVEHFDNMYVFTCLNCNSQRSLIQQMGRIRNLKDSNIMVHLSKEFRFEVNYNRLFTFEEVKKYIHSIKLSNDVFIYNKQEELNKSSENFVTQLVKSLNESNIECIFEKNKETSNIKLDSKYEIKKVKEICKNLKVGDIYEIQDEESKIKCEVLKLMSKLKFKKYNDIIIDNFYKKYEVDNMLNLLNEVKEGKSISEKEQFIRNNHIKKIIDLLGFSLSENKILDRETYVKNVNNFINSEYFKTIDFKQFNILFNFKKGSKFSTNVRDFNRHINHIFKNYGTEILMIKHKTHKNNSNDSFSLTYENNINEILLKFNTKIKPFNPNENIYNELFNEINVKIFES